MDTLNNNTTEIKRVKVRILDPGMFIGEHGNYRLDRFLGKGGNGQVWLATEIEGEREWRQVVCKIVPKSVQENKDEMLRIERTFHLTKDLMHPNICPVFGLRFDPDFGWFFVMGYAAGGTLAEWFLRQPGHENGLPLAEVLRILRPLSTALDYAHGQKILHRDLKPENIMFADAECKTPWLIDFGFSAEIHETKSMTTRQFSSDGTPFYMAPEQWRGQKQDSRTDEYALGVILYEYLSGHVPFGGNVFALANQACNEPVPPIPHASPAVNAALQKALAKCPDERFATCGEFILALEETVLKHTPAPQLPVQQVPKIDKNNWNPPSDFGYRIEKNRVVITRYVGKSTTVVIPETIDGRPVVKIGDSAFYGCSSLTSVTIPNSVTTIGNGAFNDCSGLTSVTIPDSVTTLGNGAFLGCSGLTSVTIPNSVMTIEDRAFSGCISLTSVTIPDSVTTLGNGAFLGCSGLTSVTIPRSVWWIGRNTFPDWVNIPRFVKFKTWCLKVFGVVFWIVFGAFVWFVLISLIVHLVKWLF